MADAGPALWAELHAYCRDYTLAQRDAAPTWFARFAARVACGSCRSHWVANVAAHPPPLDDPPAMFPWSVARHDAVNVRRGVTAFGVEAAQERWRA